jgi:heme A synthase
MDMDPRAIQHLLQDVRQSNKPRRIHVAILLAIVFAMLAGASWYALYWISTQHSLPMMHPWTSDLNELHVLSDTDIYQRLAWNAQSTYVRLMAFVLTVIVLFCLLSALSTYLRRKNSQTTINIVERLRELGEFDEMDEIDQAIQTCDDENSV